MRRRELGALALLPWAGARAADDDVLARALRAGGCAVVFRHGQTVSGIGDPAGFRLDTCSTQRNLNEEGRVQARRIGEWFAARQLRPLAVRSSAWCRCSETARLAFGTVQPWPPLNSTFDDAALSPAATARLREALRALPPNGFEVWVTHQVNITALTGRYAASGEAFVLDAAGTVRAQARL
ncbi:histidine phosphatase family protein [Variovorax sp. PAMC 28711]|uniref:histidine phosphatase family protein n=1 Tax=Variovorax sp. PAMC 28711 TaxID=1795631 RepID=UPI0009E7AEA5|nr:histidine phosphatase family protein [Variovorax sp. PAMC 28711]